MVNILYLNTAGHKVARRINSRAEYFEVRNAPANRLNFNKARGGDNQAKPRQAQFNNNDQLPDGVLAGCSTAASTFSHDIDCHDEQECKATAQRILEKRDELGLLELSVSSGWGLHAVCLRELGKTILENQIRFSMLTHTEMDCNAHDEQRVLFTGPADEETLLYLDDRIFDEPMSVEEGKAEYQRLKEREANGEEELPANYKKGEKHYRPWEDAMVAEAAGTTEVSASPQPSVAASTDSSQAQPMLFGRPAVDYVNTILPNGAPQGQRHNTMVRMANDLIILLDNDEAAVKKTLLQAGWVRDVVRERGEKELDNVIDSAKKLLKRRESESFFQPRPSKQMTAAIQQLTHRPLKGLISGSETERADNEQVVMLTKMGKRINQFSRQFPLLKLLCHRRKLIHYVAALFVGGGFGTTLMTRCWYNFYPSPGRKCRLNSLVMLIGRPGSGKHFAVDLYNLMMEPIRKADKAQIDALNAWNQEREKNNGASKNSTTRPTKIYRCLPPETSTAAIREAEFYAKENIDGEEWPLHVSIFDSELNNTLSQMKNKYMAAYATLWLKSFHNESGGALLKTSSSPVGEFPIHFNAVYTGTYDAFSKMATADNYNNGTTSRFACVPMGPSQFEMMEYHAYTAEDKLVDDQIREWAYKLDATKGEIPIEPISKALFSWTASKLDEACEEQSLVLEEMCKRPAWVGINFALPFIISRHWGEMVKDDDGRFKCGAGFKIDKHDIALAQFIAQAHYDFQQYFFYELAQSQYNRQAEQHFGTKPQSRTALAFKRLPDVFTSKELAEAYGYDNDNSVHSRLKRLCDDGRIQRIRSGTDKGKYRKL